MAKTIFIHNLIFYLSYLSFPFVALLCIFIIKRKKILRSKVLVFITVFVLLLTALFIYSRFIEPQIILIHNTKIETGFSAKIAVIADPHLGVYKDTDFLKRVVNKVNNLNDINAVLIVGDISYYPTTTDLYTLYLPLKDLKAPVYAVLGNHDCQMPGPPIQDELEKVLKSLGVKYLKNSSEQIPGTNITLLGLGDKFAGEDDVGKLEKFKNSDNLIVFTHNPDTSSKYTKILPDITISGHTHGGQMRVPFIYKSQIPCIGDFDQGLYETSYGKVFVSSGLGEIGLPMRLGIPPVVDVLEFY